MNAETRRGQVARGVDLATDEEAPAGRSLGFMVPRAIVGVRCIDGPLAGQLVARRHWNGRVNLGRAWCARGRRPRAEQLYAPTGVEPWIDNPDGDGQIRVVDLAFTGPTT
jgi:hypothetical protein